MNARGAASLVVGIMLAVTSCASQASAEPSASATEFAGLDPQVVAEVLANPTAQHNAAGASAADRPSLWQGMVGNFILCRQMLDVYTTWRDTGRPPVKFPAAEQPTDALASYTDLQRTYAFYRHEVASGDISRLRSDLSNDTGCGAWVPAHPGDAKGPTVADVVRSFG